MARWQPNARERLAQAALELFQERGYARTTVEDVAARAGLTERTFFRHFADKREVLFSGATDLQAHFAEAVAGAPAGASPLDAVGIGLAAAGTAMQAVPREFARLRQAVVMAHPELQERELIKLSRLASAVAEALRGRGVAEPVASLAAEAGLAVFKVGFERWVAADGPESLGDHFRTALAALKSIAG